MSTAQMGHLENEIPEITDAPALNDLQSDIESLKKDLSRVTSQVANIMAAKGTSAWENAKTNLDDVVSEAAQRGREAADTVRGIGDSVSETIEESVKTRPFATLAVAAGLGFVCGLTWRR